jgi:hypothetical protein
MPWRIEGALDRTLVRGFLGGLLLLLLVPGWLCAQTDPPVPSSVEGDLDSDCDVDRLDLNILLAARNTPAAGEEDPRDLDGDGTITVLDARKLVLLCTEPRCAILQSSCDPTNEPPTADAGPDQTLTLAAGQTAVDVPLSGAGSEDADGTIVAYVWTGVPNPPDEVTPVVSLPVGVHTFTLVVTDDDGAESLPDSCVITVEEAPNVAPTADAGPDQTLTLALGRTEVDVTLNGAASNDTDGIIAGYLWTGNPDPADEASPVVTLAVGVHTFTLIVTDDDGAQSAPDNCIITVEATPNQPPAAEAGPNQVHVLAFGQVEQRVTLDGYGSVDSDGQITSYVWTGSPDPADEPEPQLTLAAGTHVFTLVVTDDAGAQSAPDDVTIEIMPPPAVNPPQVSLGQTEYAVNEGETLSFDVTATDPDGERVSLSASPKLPNALFESTSGTTASGTFTFEPDYTQQGIYTIALTARDPLGLAATLNVQLTVNNVNRRPTLSVPAGVTVDEGRMATVQIAATDPDGDPVTLDAAPLPENALFLPSTGAVAFAPDYEQSGTYDIVCTASDGEQEVSAPLQIVVEDVDTSGTGEDRKLELFVDPVETPTFLTTTRITGSVNAEGPPEPVRMESALITGMSPASGNQGETVDVVLTGQSQGDFATHFEAGISEANFGAGITVHSLEVTGPTEATAGILIDPVAEFGPRVVTLRTDNEVAVATLGFNVTRGASEVTGILVDPDTGQAIAGAIVTIQGSSIQAVTDLDGSFTLTGAPAGVLTLVLNAPDHDLIIFSTEAPPGGTADLGRIESRATVFDPDAPPSVSLISVAGRGAADPTRITDFSELRQMVQDAILLVGGDEAGVLDAYGNQLNGEITGNGLISVTSAGLTKMAEALARGGTIPLQNILFVLSFGFEWSEGDPINIEGWLVSLQELVDRAWQDPFDEENALPVLVFNKGGSILPEAPTLSPHTRLNTLQGYLLLASILTWVYEEEFGAGLNPNASTMLAMAGQETLTVLSDLFSGILIAQTGPPPSGSGKKPFTRFWRNFFETKNNTILSPLNVELAEVTAGMLKSAMMGYTGSVLGTQVAVLNMGTMFDHLYDLMVSASATAYVPEPPLIRRVEPEEQDDGTVLVRIIFGRSTSENVEQNPFVYDLFRFRGGEEVPELVGRGIYDEGSVLEFLDPAPLQGTSFYAMTATRYSRLDNWTQQTQSWWPIAFAGGHTAFEMGYSRLTID